MEAGVDRRHWCSPTTVFVERWRHLPYHEVDASPLPQGSLSRSRWFRHCASQKVSPLSPLTIVKGALNLQGLVLKHNYGEEEASVYVM
ncbi:hypothetical protein DEO72_LG4g926 [Vigna unguiculata]|uniref:Uncharacterized protein n=1 Tax=Vigna unguiculata TaxID=3917 RepID=A0A4D6LPL8_VIGUN|nr:hypothetical protein DEO72_LG4g926 [Vigna unguiculata]